MKYPVIQWGMHIPLQILRDKTKAKSILTSGREVVCNLFPAYHAVNQVSIPDVSEIRPFHAVGQSVSVDFIDKKALFAHAEKKADTCSHHQCQSDQSVFFNCCFQFCRLLLHNSMPAETAATTNDNT